MRFRFEHVFSAPPQTVAAALLDPRYQRSLSGIGALAERSLVLQAEGPNGRVERTVRCVLDLQLTGAARRLIGDHPPAFREHAVYDPDSLSWEWWIEPEVAAELLDARGSIELLADESGCRRIVAGELAVRVPFYGPRVEQVVVEGLRTAYDEEARLLSKWLEQPL